MSKEELQAQINILDRKIKAKARNIERERELKQLALKRYEGEHKERLLEIYKQRFGEEYGEK